MQLIYFSPTGTTRTVVEAVAQGFAPETTAVVHDLTLMPSPVNSQPELLPAEPEVTIMGGPVYAGRLPVLMAQRLRAQVQGQGCPAILIVVYGNRAFDDTLLELRDLAVELGFVPVAAAAFIGEHSYSCEDWPIAPGRPDQADLSAAFNFGVCVRSKLARLASLQDVPPLHVPGNFPYGPGLPASKPVAPSTQRELCTLCGLCAQACPSGAITLTTDEVQTKADLCLRCCACIRVCPMQARVAPTSMIEFSKKFHQLYNRRQEPEFFL